MLARNVGRACPHPRSLEPVHSRLLQRFTVIDEAFAPSADFTHRSRQSWSATRQSVKGALGCRSLGCETPCSGPQLERRRNQRTHHRDFPNWRHHFSHGVWIARVPSILRGVNDAKRHWQRVYKVKDSSKVSWYEDSPVASIELLERAGLSSASSVIDIGGGASALVDALLTRGCEHLTVLDISSAGLDVARARLGTAAERVTWLAADITRANLTQSAYDVWHDRAVFHFLTDTSSRTAYVTALKNSLRPNGHALIATFAPDGPLECSGLETMRYDAPALLEVLGADQFKLLEQRRVTHVTPSGGAQAFSYALFKRFL